eukprot:scpid24838/ scgid30129/ 
MNNHSSLHARATGSPSLEKTAWPLNCCARNKRTIPADQFFLLLVSDMQSSVTLLRCFCYIQIHSRWIGRPENMTVHRQLIAKHPAVQLYVVLDCRKVRGRGWFPNHNHYYEEAENNF